MDDRHCCLNLFQGIAVETCQYNSGDVQNHCPGVWVRLQITTKKSFRLLNVSEYILSGVCCLEHWIKRVMWLPSVNNRQHTCSIMTVMILRFLSDKYRPATNVGRQEHKVLPCRLALPYIITETISNNPNK